MMLRPFFSYLGSKWKVAPRYPKPNHDVIIEPFAGSAGYALRYPANQVILVEANPKIAEVWRYLISVHPSEIRRIPTCEHVEDLPSWVPEAAEYLVGFHLNRANVRPCQNISAGEKAKLEGCGGWTSASRERIASQVEAIRHWRIIEGDYTVAPTIAATWFVDPPYQNKGYAYDFGSKLLDYTVLARWCRARRGLTIVCENQGARWLPFRKFATLGPNNVNRSAGSKEVVWINRMSEPPKNERQLVTLASMIGLSRALEILTDERAQLDSGRRLSHHRSTKCELVV